MWAWLIGLVSWVHLQLVEPIVRWWEEVVLGSWEEWLLALVRQGFEETTRFLNALGTWFLSFFSKRSYREQLRRAWQENSWQQWWGEVATRPSTLNALVANLVAQQQQQQNSNGAGDNQGCSGTSQDAPPARAVPAGPALSLTGGASAWWPRPLRHGIESVGRVRQHGASLSAKLERPVVFVQQSGMGIIDELAKRRHGLIEDAKMAAQLAVSRCFDMARSVVRAIFFLPARDSVAEGSCAARRTGLSSGNPGMNAVAGGLTASTPAGTARRGGAAGGVGQSTGRGTAKAHMPRSKSAHVSIADMAFRPGAGPGSASTSMSRRGLQRSRSYGRLRTDASSFNLHATEAPSDALSIIRAAGYPHELHTVTTDDGYVLRMERIPRPGARDVVFFMHGVLDTSMAWVSGGVTGSQAFAAWEAGMDVWLGNSRGNAPRQHQDPSRRGWKYWQYNINHMGMYDIAAQLDHIHNVKCADLGAGTVTLDLDHLGPLAGWYFGGTGSCVTGKRMPPEGNAGAGRQLLPDRAVSSLAAHGAGGVLEGPGLHSGPVAVRMRHSNSDGNLYRFGSCNSVSSGGRVAPPEAAGPASNGARSAGSPSEAPSMDLAPPTPRQSSPQQQGTATTVIGGPASIASACSLGRAPSSHGLLSPAASCDDKQHDGGGGERVVAADGPGDFWAEQPYQRRSLVPEPFGAVEVDVAPACEVLTVDSKHSLGAVPMDRTVARSDCLAGPTAGAAAIPHALGPSPRRCQNAVTLTVMTPAADSTGNAAPGAASAPAAASAAGPTTTFTLEAKTRRDFGPSHAVAEPTGAGESGALNGIRPVGSSGTFGRPSQGPSDKPRGDANDSANGGGNAAASVLGVVNSVLGPAADAVSQAVASAGAAIATAAVSATQLLHPSPQKASAAAYPPPATAASAPSALCPPASPFALITSQVNAVTSVMDVEGQGTAPRSTAAGKRAAAPAGVEAQSPQRSGATSENAGAIAHRPGAADGVTARPSPSGACSSAPHSGPGLRRRVCSTDVLAAAAVPACFTGGFAGGSTAGSGAPRLAEPERSASGLSVGSGRSLASDGGAAHGARAAWSGSFDPATASPAGPGSWPSSAPRANGTRGGSNAASACRTAAVSASCPYKLRCVAHSLGGMSVLIHLINRLREGRPHHMTRLLLLTPAGFHKQCPKVAKVVMWVLPWITRALRAVMGQSFCFPLYIPTPVGRALTFKLLLSASRIPGLGELLRLCFKALLNGDISQWDRALQMPHYSAEDMPAISVDQVLHLIQLVSTDSFRLYDYGSPAANVARYGSPTPPDVSREYWRLDLPVHLVGGRRDGIIPPPNIHRHLEAMRAQGVAVSYREFDFGHLDFTFGVKEELRMYLMKVLRL